MVAPTIVEDINRKIDDLRQRDVFDARQFSAQRVEVQKDGQTLVVERVMGKDGKDTLRNGAGKDVDEGKVGELVAAHVIARPHEDLGKVFFPDAAVAKK